MAFGGPVNLLRTKYLHTETPQRFREQYIKPPLYYIKTLEVGKHHTMDPIMEWIISCSISSSRGKPHNELHLQMQYFSSYLITLHQPLYIVKPTT
jgi:hypothetical protein